MKVRRTEQKVLFQWPEPIDMNALLLRLAL